VATNLSVALARQTSKEVLLIDLAPSMGTAAINMGLQPRYTYIDVIQNFHRIDEELLTSFLERHESGVSILASPLVPADSDSIGPEQVLALIRYCRRFFGFVVVDPGNSLNTTVNAVLMESEQQILVLTPELPALRNLKRALDTVGRMNGKPPPMVVLNQFKEGLGLSAKDVEDGLRLGLAAVLEKDDRAIFESINLGRPAVLVGKSRFSKALLALSGKIAGPDRLPIRAPSLFSRFSSNRNKTKSSKKERD
jgi:pilus assembly protein CpaE